MQCMVVMMMDVVRVCVCVCVCCHVSYIISHHVIVTSTLFVKTCFNFNVACSMLNTIKCFFFVCTLQLLVDPPCVSFVYGWQTFLGVVVLFQWAFLTKNQDILLYSSQLTYRMQLVYGK